MSILRRTRFTALVMLFAWMSILVAGVANACLLHEGHANAAQARGVMAHQAKAEVSGVKLSVPTQASQHHNDDQMLEALTCRTLCATIQTAAPKQQPQAPADAGAHQVLVATRWQVREFPGPVSAWSGTARVPRPEPPVYIRFLRLTL